MLLSIHILIATLVGNSFASSPPITSTSAVSTSIPPTITPFTSDPAYLKADPCIQSCALKYSSEHSSRLSCSDENSETCVCQGINAVISDARVCAASACPTIPTNTDYKPVVTAKVIFQKYCSNQGMVFDNKTTYWTTPTPVAANVKTPSVDDADGTDAPSPTNAATKSSSYSVVMSSAGIVLSEKDQTLASSIPVTTSSSPSSSSSTSDIPARNHTTALNPGIIAGITLGGVFITIATSFLYIWNKRRLSKRSNYFGKLDKPDPERDGEKEVPISQAMALDHRMSKPFDKVVEVCEACEGQPPDWTRSQRTTMKIDTQCENFNYISPHIVKALNLTPVPVDRQIEVTGIGEETILVDTKVQLFFRRAGTFEGVEKRYPPITFYVLKRNQDGWGLLLGTTDCLKFDVVRSAVLVLKSRKKEQKPNETTRDRDREIADHRKQTEEKKKQKREQDMKKEKEREIRDRDGSNQNRRGSSDRREHIGRA